VVNPQEAGGQTKKHILTCIDSIIIIQEWAAISQDVAQKLIHSRPRRIAEVLHQLYVIVNKSL
jgi:hypothetical protein